jgi:DNA-binding response OmpR family regulator
MSEDAQGPRPGRRRPAANVKLLQQVLTMSGYDVTTASSGAEGLAKVAAENPDIVLLDVIMPQMSGYEVCKALRSRKETALLPIVMVTALDPLEERVKGIEAGATISCRSRSTRRSSSRA